MNIIILFLVIPALIMIPVGIYLYFYIRRIAEFMKLDTKKKGIKAGIILITVVVSVLSINIWGTPALIVFHIIGFSLGIELINWIIKLIEKKQNFISKRAVWHSLYRSGLLPIVCTAAVLSFGFVNIGNVVETHYDIYTEKNIREEGYRVAMISDLHYGTSTSKNSLQKSCTQIQESNPDIVVLCGDIVEESTTLEEMNEAMKILGGIKSRYGIFYVYGNHDLATYTSSPDYSEEQLQEAMENNGIRLLKDETYAINDDFVIIGRDDAAFMKDNTRKSGEELIENIEKSKFLLLVDHQPVELQRNSTLGYDLQLSGHTHAGQIWPIGVVTEELGMVEKNYGYKKINDFQIIVSSGIVGWGYPVRTESNSEYVMIDISRN